MWHTPQPNSQSTTLVRLSLLTRTGKSLHLILGQLDFQHRLLIAQLPVTQTREHTPFPLVALLKAHRPCAYLQPVSSVVAGSFCLIEFDRTVLAVANWFLVTVTLTFRSR